MRGLTFAGLINEVDECVYEANATTRHLQVASVQAGLIHLFVPSLLIQYRHGMQS